MTLTPLALAEFWIAAPEPESRFTSNSTFAPLVMAWSAWVRWRCALFSALVMQAFRPALEMAASRKRRSWVSQRTDDLESGSSTPTSHLAFSVLTSFATANEAPAPMAAIPASPTAARTIFLLNLGLPLVRRRRPRRPPGDGRADRSWRWTL